MRRSNLRTHELDRLLAEYHPTGRRLAVTGRTVLLVDDGLVSSRNAQAAARSLRERGATRVILAVPVAESCCAIEMREWVDQVVCLEYRREPRALRFWYDDFGETTEDEIAALLSEHVGAREREVEIEVSPATVLRGHLTVPWGAYARGAVMLAGGWRTKSGTPCSGSLAAALNKAGLATLQLDLLVAAELAILGILVGAFIVSKLARRLVKLFVRRLGRRRARRGPGLVRRHTPASLLETGELAGTRGAADRGTRSGAWRGNQLRGVAGRRAGRAACARRSARGAAHGARSDRCGTWLRRAVAHKGCPVRCVHSRRGPVRRR